MSSRTSKASVGIYRIVIIARSISNNVHALDRPEGTDTRSLRSLLRDDSLAAPRSNERLIQHLERVVDVGRGDAHGRLDAQYVTVETSLADQHPHLASRFQHVERLLLRGRLVVRVAHQFHAEHQPHAAYVSHEPV